MLPSPNRFSNLPGIFDRVVGLHIQLKNKFFQVYDHGFCKMLSFYSKKISIKFLSGRVESEKMSTPNAVSIR